MSKPNRYKFNKDSKSFTPSRHHEPIAMMNSMPVGVPTPMMPMPGMMPMHMNPMMINQMNQMNMNIPVMNGGYDYQNIYGGPQYNYYQYYPQPVEFDPYQAPYPYPQSPMNNNSQSSQQDNLSPEPQPISEPSETVGTPETELIQDSEKSTPDKVFDIGTNSEESPQDPISIQQSEDSKDEILHSPIYINTSYEDFKSQDFSHRQESFISKQYTPEKSITINPYNYEITDYSKSSQKPKSNWASILHHNVDKPVQKKPITKPPPKIEPPKIQEEEIESVGKLSLKTMFDEDFSIINKCEPFKISPRGLTNTGNICYMNSILQVLIYCEPFNKLIKLMTKTQGSLTKSTTPLIDSLIQLLNDFNSGNLKSLSPEPFYHNLTSLKKFQHLKWGQQEDAEEFLGYLLDGLHEEFIENIKNLSNEEIVKVVNKYQGETKLKIQQAIKLINNDYNYDNDDNDNEGWNEVGKKNESSLKRTVEIEPSPIKTIFGGTFRSVLKIGKNQSITLDPYQCIQLDIKDDNILTIEQAFQHLNEPEQIHVNGDKDIAKKQTFIDNLPPILIIHLKRFSFLNDGNVEKILKKIKYDHTLNIPLEVFSFKNPNIKNSYQLTGVVYHHGISAEGGHYTVDVLKKSKLMNSNGSLNNNDNDEWIRIDDTLVNQIDKDEVLNGDDDSKNAYILFYQQL